MYDTTEIGRLMPTQKGLNTDFLSPKIAGILDNYLNLKCEGIPKESLLIALLVKISQATMLSRPTVTFSETTTPINIYALNFMGSGEGKDKPLKILDREIMDTYRKMFTDRMRTYLIEGEKKIIEEADEKFRSSKAEKEKYIEQKRPRQLVNESPDATVEGFMANREAFARAGFGGTLIKISEFGDYITSQNNARLEFISAITDVYDFGDSKPKVIKGEKQFSEIYGVPNSILFHTSLSGLLEGRANEQLLTFLNRGLGRRCFICCPDPVVRDFDNISYKSELAKIEQANGMIPEVKQIFADAIGFNSTILINDYKFTDEADELLFNYKTFNEYRASKQDYFEEDALRAELKNRHWKCLKLAGLIACFEHPKERVVTTDDLQSAIYITELFGYHLASFFNKQPQQPYEKMFGFFVFNINKWMSRTDLKSQKFIGKNNFSYWLDENIPLVEEMAIKKGYVLQKEDNGSRGLKYRLVKNGDEELLDSTETAYKLINKYADKLG